MLSHTGGSRSRGGLSFPASPTGAEEDLALPSLLTLSERQQQLQQQQQQWSTDAPSTGPLSGAASTSAAEIREGTSGTTVLTTTTSHTLASLAAATELHSSLCEPSHAYSTALLRSSSAMALSDAATAAQARAPIDSRLRVSFASVPPGAPRLPTTDLPSLDALHTALTTSVSRTQRGARAASVAFKQQESELERHTLPQPQLPPKSMAATTSVPTNEASADSQRRLFIGPIPAANGTGAREAFPTATTAADTSAAPAAPSGEDPGMPLPKPEQFPRSDADSKDSDITGGAPLPEGFFSVPPSCAGTNPCVCTDLARGISPSSPSHPSAANWPPVTAVQRVGVRKCYSDGSRYDGEICVASRRRCGRGLYRNELGDEYVGEWGNDTRHGHGRYYWSTGDCYEGEWDNDVIHGKGKFTWAHGEVFEGHWVHGTVRGAGTRRLTNRAVYEGNWVSSRMEGPGKKTFASGDVLEGVFVNDKIHGHGVYTWANGDRYEGNWVRGSLTGFGTKTLACGDTVTGTWLRGHLTGPCQKTFSSGDVHRGWYAHDCRHGYGRYAWAHGDSFDGFWLVGTQEGRGTYTRADGTILLSFYRCGVKHGRSIVARDGVVFMELWAEGVRLARILLTRPFPARLLRTLPRDIASTGAVISVIDEANSVARGEDSPVESLCSGLGDGSGGDFAAEIAATLAVSPTPESDSIIYSAEGKLPSIPPPVLDTSAWLAAEAAPYRGVTLAEGLRVFAPRLRLQLQAAAEAGDDGPRASAGVAAMMRAAGGTVPEDDSAMEKVLASLVIAPLERLSVAAAAAAAEEIADVAPGRSRGLDFASVMTQAVGDHEASSVPVPAPVSGTPATSGVVNMTDESEATDTIPPSSSSLACTLQPVPSATHVTMTASEAQAELAAVAPELASAQAAALELAAKIARANTAIGVGAGDDGADISSARVSVQRWMKELTAKRLTVASLLARQMKAQEVISAILLGSLVPSPCAASSTEPSVSAQGSTGAATHALARCALSPLRSAEKLCKICYGTEIDCVLIRCGHMATCMKCSDQLEKCPICRTHIDDVVRAFRA